MLVVGAKADPRILPRIRPKILGSAFAPTARIAIPQAQAAGKAPHSEFYDLRISSFENLFWNFRGVYAFVDLEIGFILKIPSRAFE